MLVLGENEVCLGAWNGWIGCERKRIGKVVLQSGSDV